jgi:hypothetical protein
MAFYKNPVIEEPPRCIVCSGVVSDGSLICSATCSDIWQWREDIPSLREQLGYDNYDLEGSL